MSRHWGQPSPLLTLEDDTVIFTANIGAFRPAIGGTLIVGPTGEILGTSNQTPQELKKKLFSLYGDDYDHG